MNCFLVKAQQNHFIYIQSETREPFYVEVNGGHYSSSPNGYLILSKLKDGAYDLTIGFARDKYPEQNFSYTINNKDAGFTLKQLDAKSFALVNLKDNATINAGGKPVVKVAEPAPEAAAKTNTVFVEEKIAPVITKALSKPSAEGLEEIYIDKTTGTKADTIAIFIPKAAKVIKPVDAIKSCVIATNDDFLKTRLQMAGATNEADMLQVAKNVFKEKCFSTEQVKNLGALILTEENRLTLFIAAKSNVYDAKNFKTLQSQFTKEAVLQQFKTAAK